MARKKGTSSVSAEDKAKLEALKDDNSAAGLPQLDEFWGELETSLDEQFQEAELVAAELEAVVAKRRDAYVTRALVFSAYRKAEGDPEHRLGALKQAHSDALSQINTTIKVEGGIKVAKAPQGGIAFEKADALRSQMEVIKTAMANFVSEKMGFSSYAEVEQLIAAENKLFNTDKEEDNA